MLQKAGGLFQLLAELDLGTNYGLKSIYFKSRTINPASTGVIRLAEADIIAWRNNANDADVSLSIDNSDVLNFNGTAISVGGAPVQSAITVSDTTTINLTLVSDVLSADIQSTSITNAMISASAAIAYSKLNLSGAIVNADVNASAAIAQSKLSLSITNSQLSGSAGITNANLATMPSSTIKGNITGGSATPTDLTGTQVTSMLNAFVGDSGSGGTKGLVPAPITGDATKFLAGNGTWSSPSGSGDVVGPASSVDAEIVLFNSTTGKLIKAATGSGFVKATSGVYSTVASIVNADVSASAAIAYSKLAALTTGRALVSDGSGFVSAATTTATEIGYVNGVTSAIQTQLGTKVTNPMTTGGDVIYGGASGTPTRLANGSAGQYFVSAGGTSAPVWTTPTLPTIQKFSSGSGTYTTPANVKYIRVRMIGAGGGGAGSGTAGGNNGGSGGNSTFGTTLLVANGGGGGVFQGLGGSGGTASLGTGPVGIVIQGGSGGSSSSGSNAFFTGGCGASTPFGGSGSGGYNSAGVAGTANTGAGGGGGSSGNTGAANYSGGGGGGGGYVNALIFGPLSTYAYAVGAAGALGAGGTNGFNGSAGSNGFIIVEEYY